MATRVHLAAIMMIGLAACGTKTSNSADTADRTAEPSLAAAAKPQAGGASAYLPPYAPLYPGAKVTSGAGGEGADSPGGVVTFETRDSPAAVVRFYKAAAAKAGLKTRVNVNMNKIQIYGAEDESGHRSLQVQASAEEGGVTKGSIVAARK